MVEIKIQTNDANQRLDKFLQKSFPNLSKSMMYKAIRNKKIKVNRKRCTFDQILLENDSILLFLPPDVLVQKEVELLKEKVQLDVVYEDENLIIVNKPYGLLSQSDQKEIQDCLVTRVQRYLYDKKEYDPKSENSFAPTICHRLDRNTTGLVIAAKNAETLRIVNEAIKNRKIHKFYRAKVQGYFDQDAFSVKKYIRKEGTKALVSSSPQQGYQLAYMDVRVLSQENGEAICEIELHTGRFHQIRALMSSLSHPLTGDQKYGYKGKQKKYSLTAYKLDLSEVDLQMNQKNFEI
ncbi:MAG: RluA family pseudouridine synthase [Bacillota bacterium]|nr:RluA family pseudouridine synthase [Bacillota bacterium]